MRILIDIGHPAHVHYFKHFIKNNIHKHKIIVVARKRDIIFNLLNENNIKFIPRGKGANSMIGKLLNTFYADILIFIISVYYRIDTLISFSTGYTAQVGWLLRRNTISINDTEHANKTHEKFVYPFSDAVITPHVYYEKIGSKHIKFQSIIEGFYLHENYFKSKREDISNLLNISYTSQYVLVRFISWNAHHDKGYNGLSNEQKELIVKKISRKYKVFISSEEDLPKSLKKYQIDIPFNQIHGVLKYSSFFFSESGTMASESAYLGTKVLYTNPLPLMGYLREAKKFDLLNHEIGFEKIKTVLESFMTDKSIKSTAISNSLRMKESYHDLNRVFEWFVLNFPQSLMEHQKNPNIFNKVNEM